MADGSHARQRVCEKAETFAEWSGGFVLRARAAEAYRERSAESRSMSVHPLTILSSAMPYSVSGSLVRWLSKQPVSWCGTDGWNMFGQLMRKLG